MSRQRVYNTLLNLDYEDIILSCNNNPESQAICNDPVFWEQKAQRDFNTSLRQVKGDRSLNPKEKYLAILSQKDIAPGSEEFVDAQECLRRAVVTGRSDLCQYFVERTGIDVDRALITAAGNKEIFDKLVIRYRVDLYSPQNIDLLYSILIEAINQKNFPLIYSLSPRASQVITDPENIEEMMTEATKTGDYEFVEFINRNYHIGTFDETELNGWLLQTALLNNDNSFSQDLIEEFLNQGQYTQLALIFVRAGEYERLKNLIELEELQGTSNLGYDILLDAVKYDRLTMVKLIAEDANFSAERRIYWFEDALDFSKELNRGEITAYLTNLLRRLNTAPKVTITETTTTTPIRQSSRPTNVVITETTPSSRRSMNTSPDVIITETTTTLPASSSRRLTSQPTNVIVTETTPSSRRSMSASPNLVNETTTLPASSSRRLTSQVVTETTALPASSRRF